MRTVAIVIPISGTIPPERREGIDEFWGVNSCWSWHNDYLTRMYFMDSPSAWGAGARKFTNLVNAFTDAGGIVYSRETWSSTPGVKPYPLDEVLADTRAEAYFTSTICYMIAHAITEGVDRLVYWGVHLGRTASDYVIQRPCIDYWTGLAQGRGIEISFEAGCQVCQTLEGQARRYAYDGPDDHIALHGHMQQCATSLGRVAAAQVMNNAASAAMNGGNFETALTAERR